MKHLVPLLVLVAAFAGCSSDGGVVGSGISSIGGNVIQVELTGPDSGVAGASSPTVVQVSLDEAPGVETLTATDGSFILEGSFSGDLTLRFRTADGSNDLATRSIHLPEGASVFLEDIGVAPGAVEVAAERLVEFRGEVNAVDCNAAVLVVVDESHIGNRFTLHLIEDSELVDRDGNALSCEDLQRRTRVLVEHSVPEEDGSNVLLRLVVSPSSETPPAVRIPVRLRGTAVNVNCQAGQLRIDDLRLPDHRARVILADSTEFACVDDVARPCSCTDLQVGDTIAVDGIISGRNGNVLRADVITRTAPPAEIRAKVSGPVVAKACERGGFLVEDPRFDEIQIAIQVLPHTVFECTGRPDLPCTCDSVRLREFVTIEGTLRARAPTPLVEAASVKIRRAGPPVNLPRPTRTPRP